MPDAIGEQVGVRVERLEDADNALMQKRFPNNAKDTGVGRGFDDEWRGRRWQW
jgi:hypothetical protein